MKDRTAISWLAVIGFILFLAATACGDAGPGAPGDGVWLLESLDGQPIFEESTITLRITGNQLDGFGGCNRYGGAFDVETPVAGADGDFSIPPFLVTEKWCGFVDRADSDVIVDQEDAYISALTQGERYRVAGGRLEILDGEGATRLVFVRKTSLPRQSVDLRGTSWRLITDDDVDNIERVTTLNFNGQQVSGSSACGDYLGSYKLSYELSEVSLRLPSRSKLGSAESCSELDRKQADEFLRFLAGAWQYSVHEEQGISRLKIRSHWGRR